MNNEMIWETLQAVADLDKRLTIISASTDNLLRETITHADKIVIALGIITIILGVAILWNQRKIKKILREMQEQNACASKKETQQESNQP